MKKERKFSSSCSQGLLIKLEDYVMRLDIFAQGMKTEEKEKKEEKNWNNLSFSTA